MNFKEEFCTSELLFCPICVADGAALFDSVSSKSFPDSLPLSRLSTLDDAKQWCAERATQWLSGDCFVWTCRRVSDLSTVGQVTLLPQSHQLALAYWISPQYWGQGIAVEMCQAVLRQASLAGYRGLIWAGVHNWNHRSQGVLRKLGFTERLNTNQSDVNEYVVMIGADLSI